MPNCIAGFSIRRSARISDSVYKNTDSVYNTCLDDGPLDSTKNEKC